VQIAGTKNNIWGKDSGKIPGSKPTQADEKLAANQKTVKSSEGESLENRVDTTLARHLNPRKRSILDRYSKSQDVSDAGAEKIVQGDSWTGQEDKNAGRKGLSKLKGLVGKQEDELTRGHKSIEERSKLWSGSGTQESVLKRDEGSKYVGQTSKSRLAAVFGMPSAHKQQRVDGQATAPSTQPQDPMLSIKQKPDGALDQRPSHGPAMMQKPTQIQALIQTKNKQKISKLEPYISSVENEGKAQTILPPQNGLFGNTSNQIIQDSVDQQPIPQNYVEASQKSISVQKESPLIQLEAGNPEVDYISEKSESRNQEMLSFMQDLEHDNEFSHSGPQNKTDPSEKSSKVSRFHPSNSPERPGTPRKVKPSAEGIYAQSDYIAEGQQRLPDHYNAESPPTTPESPPQPIGLRQMARPIRLGLSQPKSVVLTDKPKLLLRYVFRKVAKMVGDVSRLMQDQQQALRGSVSLTFKGLDGAASPSKVLALGSPQESRNFDFMKATNGNSQSQQAVGPKVLPKLDFDIYQPKEFNMGRGFSNRSNSPNAKGLIFAVNQFSSIPAKGFKPEEDLKNQDSLHNLTGTEGRQSKDASILMNRYQDVEALKRTKSQSNENRSVTNSSAMKELSYEEFAESYGADGDDKNTSALMMSHRKQYEKHYIGYFDFKQKVS
jgi:hypothetical protein